MAINDTNVVSDPFWLNIGAEEVYNSTINRKDAVLKLQAAIAWVFTVYTATTMGSVVFAKKDDWNIYSLLLLGFAFMSLTMAYWLATIAYFPVPQSFYAAEPESVRAAFNKAAKRNSIRFKLAVILTSIGVFFYSIGLLAQFGAPVFKKYFGGTEKCAGLSAVLVKSNNAKMIILRISSTKNSWNQVWVLHDTVANKKKITDSITVDNCRLSKEHWLFADSTATCIFKFKDPQKQHLYVIISRVDTLLKEKLVQTNKLKYSIY